MTKIPTIEEMLKAGMHFGHKSSKWHPKMETFIFGKRNGIHIIDLVKSQKFLEKALVFMAQVISEEKTILFVGTKSQVKKPMQEVARALDMPYATTKWIGGSLTNFAVIKKLTRKYQNLLEQKSSGKLEKYTKKERLNFDRDIERLETKVGGLVKLNKLPDLVFVWDVNKEANAIEEAKIKNIPVVAICDTNVNPSKINYIIPSNDDATKTIKLITDLLKDYLMEAKNSKAKK